jgi:hypothetical protein
MDINPDRKRDWGRRVDVFWEGDGVYYRGTVTGYSTTSGKHTIMYDDGDVERVKLSDVSSEIGAREGWEADRAAPVPFVLACRMYACAHQESHCQHAATTAGCC